MKLNYKLMKKTSDKTRGFYLLSILRWSLRWNEHIDNHIALWLTSLYVMLYFQRQKDLSMAMISAPCTYSTVETCEIALTLYTTMRPNKSIPNSFFTFFVFPFKTFLLLVIHIFFVPFKTCLALQTSTHGSTISWVYKGESWHIKFYAVFMEFKTSRRVTSVGAS